MVLVSDVLETKKKDERAQIRSRLPAKLERLMEIAETNDFLTHLKSIEFNIDKLIRDKTSDTKKATSEELATRRKYYMENKEAILDKEKKRRREIRGMVVVEKEGSGS